MAIETLERRGRPEGLHHIGPAVRGTEQRVLARNGHNPLWESVVRYFERQFGASWETMDGIERGITRTFYKREKAAKKKPVSQVSRPEPIHRGYWDPVPASGGK